jgi:hypothetical protein
MSEDHESHFHKFTCLLPSSLCPSSSCHKCKIKSRRSSLALMESGFDRRTGNRIRSYVCMSASVPYGSAHIETMSHDSHLHLPKSQSTKVSLLWVLLPVNPRDSSPSLLFIQQLKQHYCLLFQLPLGNLIACFTCLMSKTCALAMSAVLFIELVRL